MCGTRIYRKHIFYTICSTASLVMEASEKEEVRSPRQEMRRQASAAAVEGLITQEEKQHIQEQLKQAERDGAGLEDNAVDHLSLEVEEGVEQGSDSTSSASVREESTSSSSSSSSSPKLSTSLRKRRAHSTGPIASYEVKRMTKHRMIFGQQGKLRQFWRRVQKHQSAQLSMIENIAKFVRERATVQLNFAAALEKLAAGGSSLSTTEKPRIGLDVTCNELLEAETATAKWMGDAAKKAIQDVCKKGLEKLAREYKNACSRFGKRGLKVGRDIDTHHSAVLKAHRAYLKCFESTMRMPSGRDGSDAEEKLALRLKERVSKGGSSCLWMAETSYTRTAKMYESTCKMYRNEMSELYLEYQKLELNRVTRLRELVKDFVLLIRDSFAGAAGDSQVVCALAAIEELDPQREVVTGLNQLNVPSSQPQAKQGGAPANGTDEVDNLAMPPPPPMQSRLILKSGTVLLKSGLLRSWKPFHAVLTADSYLHLFDANALLERGASVKLPPTYEPFITLDTLASTAIARPESHTNAFELTTNSTGFLGMKSQKRQEFRAERENQVHSWISAFERVKQAALMAD